MDALPLFALHIATYSFFPFLFSLLESTSRQVAFYIYMALVLCLGGFLGTMYNIPIGQSFDPSAGGIAYGALMMCAVLLVISEGTIQPVRTTIRLVFAVNAFVFCAYSLIAEGLDSPQAVNPLGIPAAAFDVSLWLMVLGGVLIVFELLIMLVCFDQLKKVTKSPALAGAMYTAVFVAILCLDGILFPVLVLGFRPDLTDLVVNNLANKFVVGSAFAVPILLYLTTFPHLLGRFHTTPLRLNQLFRFPSHDLRAEIARQQEFVAMSKRQLQKLAERLSLSAEAAGIGFWEYDIERRRLNWDQRCCEIHGIEPRDFDGRVPTWLAMLDPQDRELIDQQMSNIDTSEWPAVIGYKIPLKDGSTRYIEGYAMAPRKVQGGRSMLGILLDVSERQLLELERHRLKDQLHQAQKLESIGQFAGGIAHDFNNLLTPIIGYSELNMEQTSKDSSLHLDLEEIRKAGLRAQELTRKLLAFGRQQVIEPRRIDLNPLIVDLDQMVARLVGVRIERQLALCPEPAWILADQGQIERLLLNLIANARDAIGDKGCIRIETAVEAATEALQQDSTGEKQVVLRVIDDGAGIEPDVLEHIFEPFFTTKDRDEGTGLGLASCFGIVKQHGGDLSIESVPGKGSMFIATFPECVEPARENTEHGGEEAKSPPPAIH